MNKSLKVSPIRTQKEQTEFSEFIAILDSYKRQIDDDIGRYSQLMLSETHEQFGEYPAEAVRAFTSLLSRGGKRIRGALAMHSYQMLGGKDGQVAIESARAIEMLHAYILMVDDIQDRSELRRGDETAHVMLRSYHQKNHLKADAQHFGESIAINGFLVGAHHALDILANLDVSADYRLQAIRNVNKNFISTAHGQSMDIFNEVTETADEQVVDNVLLWKTAYYTFMNPLQLGAILAGANSDDLEYLEKYSLHAGRVFQITDDILGIYGKQEQSGKSPLDDIREGKRTILTVRAIKGSPKADAYFLTQMLGNEDLTQAEFVRCQNIIEQSGALAHAQKEAEHEAKLAVDELKKFPKNYGSKNIKFLRDLVNYLLQRKS